MNILVLLTGVDLKIDKKGIVRFKCKGSIYDTLTIVIIKAIGEAMGTMLIGVLKLERM